MKFEDLVEFVEKRMAMSHIYQPLLIRALVESDGSATLRQLAQAFLFQDESQLTFYERKIKQMPLPVLMKHGIVSRDGELVSLTTPKMTYVQKAQVKMACEKRLQNFIQKKGLGIWDYRFLDTDPVPDSLRFKLLKEAGGRCALCGATKNERPLDIDHIKPRSRKGKNEEENLQVLCSKCNRSKGNKDETDFRKLGIQEPDPSCPFCSSDIKSRKIEEFDSVFAIEDKFPVTPGHLLIIPLRHTPDFFTMTGKERTDAEELIRLLRNKIVQNDRSVNGFNVGVNCGISAGQTIDHAHIHLIPRRNGDTPSPRGGVRGVIPEKMNY
jgi:ATP adenylyltransferase